MALQDPHPHPAEPGPGEVSGAFLALVLPTAGSPADDFKVAGISVFERQRRQLTRLGAASVQPGGASRDQSTAVLLIEAGLVADERLIAAFLAEARRRGPTARPLLAVGPDGLPGGLAWLPAAPAIRTAPDWKLLAAGAADRFDLAGIDDYAPERRRRVPLMWERPRNRLTARQVGAMLLAAAQKGCLDWPARFIHPPIENLGVRLLLPTPITPNMVSILAFLMGLYAAWCFATGAMWTGLVLALAIGPIDGIDGKLARTRVEFSRWGDIEHAGDKIVEYLWFAALAAAIGTGWAWALATLVVLLAFAEAIQGEFYRRLTGFQLDDAGPAERRFRLISGRRNTFFWSLLPFAWFGRWDAGLVMIAIYAATTFLFMQWRFFVRLAEYGRANSPAIAANLDATAYGFLEPDRSAGGTVSGQDNQVKIEASTQAAA